MFSKQDISQIESLGISLETIEKQIGYFKNGFPFINLDRPATAGDGIISFDEDQKEFFINFFNSEIHNNRIEKFVPASGAASRMFKSLFEFREHYHGNSADYENFLNDRSFNSPLTFFENIEKFAFYKDLSNSMTTAGDNISEAIVNKKFGLIIDYLLSDKGLGYSNLPKALLKFHNYPDGSRVAIEEHLVEAALYASEPNGSARIHFTLSPEHIEKFQARIQQVINKYQDFFHVNFHISHSIQEKSTDTIAVDIHNEPFRTPAGELLFRPGGHGALINNLNKIDADIIFIKNIDNIVPDRLKGPTVEYKKLIGGYLLFIRGFIFNFLNKSEEDCLSEEDLSQMSDFAKNKLNIKIPEDFHLYPFEERKAYLTNFVNHPIRVCGMVKNQGEPGGGPFWVNDKNGTRSLQIVESSQVDPSSESQQKVLRASTHFSPVDLVCSIRDFKARTFNLKDFIDSETGFIAFKSSGGKLLKALELPGLWNGAMANWITIFVEVPIITFNPVKTVNDLLRKEHQP
jgi:hypothetical protein